MLSEGVILVIAIGIGIIVLFWAVIKLIQRDEV